MDKYGNPKEIKVTLPDCLQPLGLAGVEVNLTEPNLHCEPGCMKTIKLEKEAVKEHTDLLMNCIKEYSKGTLWYILEAKSERSDLRIDLCGCRFSINGEFESPLFTEEENKLLWGSDIHVIPNALLIRLVNIFTDQEHMNFSLIVYDKRTLADAEDSEEDSDEEDM